MAFCGGSFLPGPWAEEGVWRHCEAAPAGVWPAADAPLHHAAQPTCCSRPSNRKRMTPGSPPGRAHVPQDSPLVGSTECLRAPGKVSVRGLPAGVTIRHQFTGLRTPESLLPMPLPLIPSSCCCCSLCSPVRCGLRSWDASCNRARTLARAHGGALVLGATEGPEAVARCAA